MRSRQGKQELAKMVRLVRLDDDVHARITKLGKMNESYNDVIRRILDFYEEKSKK